MATSRGRGLVVGLKKHGGESVIPPIDPVTHAPDSLTVGVWVALHRPGKVATVFVLVL